MGSAAPYIVQDKKPILSEGKSSISLRVISEQEAKRIAEGEGRKRGGWVSPIRDKSDVLRVSNYLYEKAENAKRADSKRAAWRNWLMFNIGINVGLRVSDLCMLRWRFFFEDDMKTFAPISRKHEQKTGKMKNICVNDSVKNAITTYIEKTGVVPVASDFLFLKSKMNPDGTFDHIGDDAVADMVKDFTKNCGLHGNYCTHSIRKTYAYHKYMMLYNSGDPMALVKVQTDLNHRNSAVTATYLGLTAEDNIADSEKLADYWED